MSAQKRPRLFLRKASIRRDGHVRQAMWYVLDRGKHVATGCSEGEVERADQFLAEYIQLSYAPERRERDIDSIPVSDVLSVYLDDVAPLRHDPKNFPQRIARL